MMRKYLLGSLSVIFLLLLWYSFSLAIDNPYVLPNPVSVMIRFFRLLFETETYLVIFTTLYRLLIAFTVSVILGIIFGLLSGNYSFIAEFLKPLVSISRTLPVASIIIIILIIFGNQFSLYLITFLMIFPLIYEATKDGILNIPEDLNNNIALETHHLLVIMIKIQLPLAFSHLKTALFQGLGLGFKVIVMAEFISQTTRGIGKELYSGSISINYELVFAWTLIIIILVLIFELLLNKIKKYI